MKPYYDEDGITIYHGDCLEINEWLTADVLVTDPPYGINWKQRTYLTIGRPRGHRSKFHEGIQNDGDTSARDAALVLWGERPALVFGSAEAARPPGARRTLVWQKPADSGLFGSTIWRKDWEPIYVVGKWPQLPATQSSVIATGCGSHRQYARDVHPHAKPTDVLCRLIEHCPAGVIADPFMGSGSTLRAAKDLARNAVGVEIEERYCEIAAKRLAQGVLDFGAAS